MRDAVSPADVVIPAKAGIHAVDRHHREISVATVPRPEVCTMSREAFITMMEQLGDNSTIVDIRGRRIYNVQSVHSGMMVFVQTVTGVTKIILE